MTTQPGQLPARDFEEIRLAEAVESGRCPICDARQADLLKVTSGQLAGLGRHARKRSAPAAARGGGSAIRDAPWLLNAATPVSPCSRAALLRPSVHVSNRSSFRQHVPKPGTDGHPEPVSYT